MLKSRIIERHATALTTGQPVALQTQKLHTYKHT